MYLFSVWELDLTSLERSSFSVTAEEARARVTESWPRGTMLRHERIIQLPWSIFLWRLLMRDPMRCSGLSWLQHHCPLSGLWVHALRSWPPPLPGLNPGILLLLARALCATHVITPQASLALSTPGSSLQQLVTSGSSWGPHSFDSTLVGESS